MLFFTRPMIKRFLTTARYATIDFIVLTPMHRTKERMENNHYTSKEQSRCLAIPIILYQNIPSRVATLYDTCDSCKGLLWYMFK